MQTLRQDIGFAIRLLRRSPGFTVTAILVIALATGANTAVFSLVYSVVFRPLPFPEPFRLVSVTQFNPVFNQSVVSSPTYLDWSEGSSSLAQIAAYSVGDYTLTTGGIADRIAVGLVTHDLFDVLGVHPIQGRNFSATEDRPGADGVAIVSEGFLKERLALGGDRGMSWRIELDGKSYEVIGAIPESLGFPPGVRIWVPLALNPADRMQGGPVQLIRVVGRLRRGTTPEALSASLQTISGRSSQSWTAGSRVVILPLRVWLTGKTQQVWFILLGAVVTVLLIACANVAGLLIARGAGRRQEMAIRLALGAPVARLRQQLLTESSLLCLMGSAAGLVLAAILVYVLLPLIPDSMLAGRAVHLDGPVFLFTALVAVAAGLLFGGTSARDAGRVDVSDSLKQGSHTMTHTGRSIRMRSALVSAEIALSMALVITASLMARSFIALTAVDPGFRPDHLLSFSVNLPSASYREPQRQQQFYARAIEAAAALPGIRSAGLVSALPFRATGAGRALVSIEGEPSWGAADSERHRVESLYASADYFRTMGIALIEGRTFGPSEMTQHGQAVVINESMARRFFGRASAVSRRLKTGLAESPSPWLTVVGVVRDSKRTALDEDVSPTVFRPYQASTGLRSAGFVLRCVTDSESVTGSVRKAFAALDREVAISDSQSMERRLSGSMAPQRLRSIASALLAFLAVAIVLAGLYGLLSYIVSQRTAELGLRIALGAQPSSIFGMVLRQGLTLAFAGTIAGVGLSIATSGFLRGLLFSVAAVDPMTLLIAALGMLAITAAACTGPATRATRTDPMRCLRQE
jgi:putative ABC transport system permease protein